MVKVNYLLQKKKKIHDVKKGSSTHLDLSTQGPVCPSPSPRDVGIGLFYLLCNERSSVKKCCSQVVCVLILADTKTAETVFSFENPKLVSTVEPGFKHFNILWVT